MRRKRKRATSVVVDGVVHAIGGMKQASMYGELNRSDFGEYPLPQRMSRAQRKARKVRLLKEQTDPLVWLACEPRLWRSAPRTRAAVNCMTCLVVAARLGR